VRRQIMKAASVGVIIAAVLLTATGASAATAKGSGRPQAFHIPVPPNVRVMPQGAPSGCNLYRYCTYNQGNGGDLCEQMASTGNLNSACANKNDSGYNNRTLYGVNLYWGYDESGAYYYLGAGDYLLYMTENYFNQCNGGGHSCSGYGQEIGYNLASVLFD
jgi:hypothetical protein